MPKRRRKTQRLNRSSRSGPFPRSAIVSLRYVDNLATLDPIIGTVGAYTFRANDIFDPNATGAGHQPYGHDTLATVYHRYKVLSSKITVVFHTTGGDAVSSGTGAIQLSTVGTATTNPTLFLEQPETTYKAIGPLSGPGGITKLTKTYNAARFYGKRRNKDLTADFGVSPAEVAFFHIGVQGVLPADDMAKVDMTTTITYRVLVTEPEALGQS